MDNYVKKKQSHKSVKWSKNASQTIKIYDTDIGYIGGNAPQDKENPRQEISA
jgi:hypothetical protein